MLPRVNGGNALWPDELAEPLPVRWGAEKCGSAGALR